MNPNTHTRLPRSTKYLACHHCSRAVAVSVEAIRCLCWACAPNHRLPRWEQDEMLLPASCSPAPALTPCLQP